MSKKLEDLYIKTSWTQNERRVQLHLLTSLSKAYPCKPKYGIWDSASADIQYKKICIGVKVLIETSLKRYLSRCP